MEGVKTVPPKVGRPPKVYDDGRHCQSGGCITVLSIYNKDKFCYQHQPMKRPRLRGRMPSEIMEEEQKLPRCLSCPQRRRWWQINPPEIEFEGIVHLEGLLGAATLCESAKPIVHKLGYGR